MLLGSPVDVTEFTVSSNYRDISNYTDNGLLVVASAMTELRSVMGFDQFRFYCRKVTPGRTFHVMTNKDAKGEAVVRYFTDSPDSPATACNSFTALPDDTSNLSGKCRHWGHTTSNRWGADSLTGEKRMYSGLVIRPYNAVVKILYNGDPKGQLCDQSRSTNAAPMVGDEWKFFVR